MQITLPARPDARSSKTYDIREDKWTQVYQRSRDFVDHIWIHNIGTQSLYLSDKQNPEGDNYSEIGPGEFHMEETDPAELWIQRSSPDNNPKVRVTCIFYSSEQIARLKKMKEKFEG